jgi:precorrin-2 dehydrogenase/sirohydrochlorin ferrochelatase
MLPVMLDVMGQRVVVVGHGAVGQRKAAAARNAGADVVVVDPALNEPYRPEHLDGARLVFACATADVNARVVSDAQARGIWVNAASDPATGDFNLPSVIRAGGLTLAVSTGGAAPALARRVREKLEAEFDAAFADWVALLDELRAEVQATIADAARRRALLEELSDWPWLERLRAEGVEAARMAMRERIAASRVT